MTLESLKEAITEAQRFIARAEEVLHEAHRERDNEYYTFQGTALSGAARRASISDLSRALSRMRAA